MDPQATLYDLFDAIRRGKIHDAEDALERLLEWNRIGGFSPDIDGALKRIRSSDIENGRLDDGTSELT